MSTGPSAAVRALVIAREDGCCARCGLRGGDHVWPPHQIHHRRPRGMGGTSRKDTNSPAALLYLCASCHARTESRRAEALDRGLLVRQTQDPAAVPVLYRSVWVLLRPDGTTERTAA